MDYKEMYEQAIKRAKAMIQVAANQEEIYNSVITIFPELKESEDERMVQYFKDLAPFDKADELYEKYGFSHKDAIAWLEKQGEQDMIPLDKAIKFLDDQLVNDKDKVTGESFINFRNYGAFKETFISYFKRKMLEKQGEKNNLSIDFVLGCLGIKPAYKDGNAWCILLGDNIQEGICGFGDTKEEALIAFIKELIGKQSKKPTIVDIMKNYFATTPKEQQDKDLEELKHLNNFGWELIEQKPAWSEEDEVKMKELISYLVKKKSRETDGYAIFLKSLKFRLLSPSIREFDKEEGSIIDHLIAICDDAMCYKTFAGCYDIEKCKTFLTNLKFGILPQPQPTWKPSEEHINWLIWAINRVPNEAEAVLRDLLEQLNKLREE